MAPASREDGITPNLAKSLQSLPLIEDDPYIYLQAQDLGIVDEFIAPIESNLLREYLETDRTPLPNTLIVSALSKLWVFGIYEFLRTWRQRIRNVLQFVDKVISLEEGSREALISRKKEMLERKSAIPETTPFQWRAFEEAIENPAFVQKLQRAYDSSERTFRRIEAFRVNLAKHEIPRSEGSFGMYPGYSRIDMITGSISWSVGLGNNEVDIITRQQISESCRKLAIDRPLAILPREIQEKLKPIPQVSYGNKRVILILEDSTEYECYVAWNKEIGRVEGFDDIPFDPNKIRDVIDIPNNSDPN